MFINHDEIRDRLLKGELVLEGSISGEDQLETFTLGIRLGTQFGFVQRPRGLSFPDPTSFPASDSSDWEPLSTIHVGYGEKLLLYPGEFGVATTAEFLKMPFDLAGFFFGVSRLQSVGVLLMPGTVDPGFHGKLTLSLANVGSKPVVLYPGMRIARIAFAEVRNPTTSAGQWVMHHQITVSDEDAIQVLSERSKQQEHQVRPGLYSAWLAYTEAQLETKGVALEALAAEIIESIDGLTVTKRNARTKAEEFDIVVLNHRDHGLWRIAGSHLLVECKNWSDKVGAREISILADKLHSISPDVRVAILVAPNGVSGSSHRDATLKLREKRQVGQYIILLDASDLEKIANGTAAETVLEQKYDELMLI